MALPAPPSPDEIRRMIDELRNLPMEEGDVTLMDYHSEYLKSPLWRKIKRRVLKRDNNICGSCGGIGNIVHHRSYSREVLEGNADHMLATVCEGCHNIIHFDNDKSRRSEEESERVFLAGQRQTDFPLPHIDLRRRSQRQPVEWPRMTAVQRELWNKKAQQLLRERKARLRDLRKN